MSYKRISNTLCIKIGSESGNALIAEEARIAEECRRTSCEKKIAGQRRSTRITEGARITQIRRGNSLENIAGMGRYTRHT